MPLASEEDKGRPLGLRGLLFAGLIAAAGSLAAASPLPEEQAVLAQKARLVESVIMRSMRAVAGLGDANLDELGEARRLLDSGRRALDEGRAEAARTDLDRALKLAVQFSGRQQQGEGSAAWLKARYDQRLDGVNAFRRTFDDIVREKGKRPTDVIDLAALDAAVTEGERVAAAGHYGEADRHMRRAYDMLAQALAQLRNHETIEHRLVFATPADEYAYEVERFRSHEMLLQMMGGNRPVTPEVRRDIEQFRAAAHALAGQARAHAGAGDFQRAVEAGEAATEQLVRALREAGLFLPN